MFSLRNDRSQGRGLHSKLAVIEALVFVLPFFVACYLLYERRISLEAMDLAVVSLLLILVLGGMVFLRQIFDGIVKISVALQGAREGNLTELPAADVAELAALSHSLTDIMARLERTTEALGAKVMELTAIRELYDLARRSLDLEALLRLLLEKAMAVTEARIGSVVVPDTGIDGYRLLYTRGVNWDLPPDGAIDIEPSVLRQVIETKRPLLVRDIEQDDRTKRVNSPRYGAPSFLSLPVLVDDQLVAVINLAKKGSGKVFEEEDLQAVLLLVEEIGFALENATLHRRIKGQFEEIKERNRRLEEEIGERKALEERLRQLQENLERMVKDRTTALEREIEERRRAEETLRRSEERYRSHFANVSDVIYSLGRGLTFVEVSPSARTVLGLSPEELVGRSVTELFATKDHDRCVADLKKILAEQKGLSAVYELNTAGESRLIEVNATPVVNDGQVESIICVARDITGRKKLEADLLQAQKMEAIGTLAGGIAHDFNNVLTNIQGNVSLLLMGMPESHPHYEPLRQIDASARSAAELTRQLLGFARKGKLRVEPTDMRELARRTVAMFGRTRRDIVIRESYDEGLWPVEVDRVQMEQVLLNLLVNAGQAMPGGGQIRVTVQNLSLKEGNGLGGKAKPGRYVRLTVADTGVGMDEKTKERIFEPFFTTKEMGRGTGLGLSTVYGIVKGHNGLIDVWSEKGKGSAFHIYLPVSDEKTVAAESATLEPPLTGSETVLLVDDEKTVAAVSRAMLEKLGYRILTASSGQEALAIYTEQSRQIDLVLLDMVMPGMGGDEVFLKLKEIDPSVCVIVATGYDSREGKATALIKDGCRAVIQKPYDLMTLSRTLREVLDEKGRPAPLPPQ